MAVHLVTCVSEQVGSSRVLAIGNVSGSFPICENVVVRTTPRHCQRPESDQQIHL
jgi:hypothetical protein